MINNKKNKAKLGTTNLIKTNALLKSDLQENHLDLRKYFVDISSFKFLEDGDENEIEIENFDLNACEQKIMIMMIGLPCSGKTTYALNYVNKINIFILI